MSSYCGFVHPKIRAFDKDLPLLENSTFGSLFCRMRRAPKQQISQMLLSSEKIFQEEGRGWIWISKHVFFPEISLWKVGPLMIYWNDHKSLPCNCRWINLFSSSRTIFVCAVVWLNSNLSKLMIREMHLRSIFICIAM